MLGLIEGANPTPWGLGHTVCRSQTAVKLTLPREGSIKEPNTVVCLIPIGTFASSIEDALRCKDLAQRSLPEWEAR